MAWVPVGRPGMRAPPERADLCPGSPWAQRGDGCSLAGTCPGDGRVWPMAGAACAAAVREGAGLRFRGAPWLTAQVAHTGGMGDSPADGAEAGEVFDRELTASFTSMARCSRSRAGLC
jgi:hypothetical protein